MILYTRVIGFLYSILDEDEAEDEAEDEDEDEDEEEQEEEEEDKIQPAIMEECARMAIQMDGQKDRLDPFLIPQFCLDRVENKLDNLDNNTRLHNMTVDFLPILLLKTSNTFDI